jgi:hypothetical protein
MLCASIDRSRSVRRVAPAAAGSVPIIAACRCQVNGHLLRFERNAIRDRMVAPFAAVVVAGDKALDGAAGSSYRVDSP